MEQTQQNQNQSRLKNRRPTPGDIQVISVDAAQFKPNINFDEFYVHDSRQANMGQDYRTNVIVVQSNQPRQNQTKSIMSNNSHRHGRQQQTNNPIYNVQNDIFKLDSLSVSSNSGKLYLVTILDQFTECLFPRHSQAAIYPQAHKGWGRYLNRRL